MKKIENFIGVGSVIITDVFNSAVLCDDVLLFLHSSNIKIDAVGTFREDLVVVTADVAALLNCRGVGQLTARRTSNNKLAMRNCLAETEGVNQPQFIPFNIYDTDLNFQNLFNKRFVIKPTFGTASHRVMLIDPELDSVERVRLQISATVNKDHREAFTRFKGNMLAEEYIPGKLVSIDGFVSNKEVYIMGSIEFIMGKEPYFTQVSSYIPARLTDEEFTKCSEMAKIILHKIGVEDSAFHIEFRINNGNPYFIEIGARLPGAAIHETYSKVYGINMLDLVFKCWLGESIPSKFIPLGVNFHTFVYSGLDKPGILLELNDLGSFVKDDSSAWYSHQISKVGDLIDTYPNTPTPLLEFSCS